MKTLKLIVGLGILFISLAASAVDLGQIQRDLATKGVEGWIHGSVEERGVYAFTYRNPDNFFDYVIMSLVADEPALQAKLATFTRHDKVRVKGSFMQNPSPQKHIAVTSIELVKHFESAYASEPYKYEAKIPEDLLHTNSGVFLVHAIGGEGHILVVEYKDAVIPVYVENAALTKNLFRNDIVRLAFKIQEYPDRPMHLNIDASAVKPVEVVESIKALHGKPAAVEGALILFPKSPEIAFNVFAVQQLLPNGINRQFTLVNMDDPKLFAKIREALQKAWDRHPGAYVNGRNKLVSTKIRVKAVGTFNEVDPNQANAQIFLTSLESLKIIEN